ncbi:MAG: PRC-barrel domain containing protein [Gammaproteobacteria bacterium]|nr:PRC-barrel domain containing protein [Gammaproteobacteria bacterium]NIR98233.1 PRC-barrel domain containing protein [Gammaproteobacteria bacterium]NIT63904.1 PRC-barrel domain containing protein [Gammaproteobacteria bacterium]NIV20908.1 hypothetical protein [Gammaproteobacteria bacterium]NIY32484.1 hypothetical protein [Gammaproteobacteria bacterium]
MNGKLLMTALLGMSLSLGASGIAWSVEHEGEEMGAQAQAAAPDMSRSYNARELIGNTIKNPKGDKLGSLDTLILDRSTGQITYGVVKTGLPVVGKSYVVPWERFEVTPEQELTLDVESQEQLQSEFAAFEVEKPEAQKPEGEEAD